VYDKGVVFVSEVMPESLIRQGPIKAILACRVTDKPTSELSPASSAQALRALAPTSMIAFSGNGAQAMAQMLRLLQQCPTWSLDLGRDTHRLPDLISGLLNAT
jgi:hypothetical protein